jgi:hypothetical protein
VSVKIPIKAWINQILIPIGELITKINKKIPKLSICLQKISIDSKKRISATNLAEILLLVSNHL